MTRAPANLLAVRTLLLTHLDNAPGPDDLEPAEVGIVGDPAHRGGYHCGSDRVVTNDYSVVESPRDRAGLTLDAAALDVGGFEVRAGGRTHTLSSFSLWCVGQCVANAADTRDIREIIYSPDGSAVRRWDRLGKRTSGDSSHRWHTHFSFFRDAIKAGRDQTPLFRRYLTTTGLLEDDMPLTDDDVRKIWTWDLQNGPGTDEAYRVLNRTAAMVAQLAGKDVTDEQAIIAGVLAGLTPEKIAAAIPPTMAKQVADELARRLAA
ncbi:hypothetical protein [Micromonospora sp. U21]|uniref:hypothetical protein n=1 Tax=Micromonospora sp. U21 TaxID=2824899 RepID=UPI001B36F9FB|nr:hypothetical protein [Micromonospora sp. U21]MBQ0903387.1 hypothetical protein [Micromonospora sp. U21]